MNTALKAVEFRARRSALGFRCWDPVLDRIVTAGLRVSLVPSGSPRAAQAAVLTANGYYGFHDLFGLSSYETDGLIPDPKPEFVLNVVDPGGRYLPLCRVLSLPWQGGEPFLSSQSAANVEPTFPGLMLVSAAARRLPAGVEVVRADLWDDVNEAPAAFAQLKVLVDGIAYLGVADARGRVSVPLTGLAPNDDSAWLATVSVQYEVLPQPFPTGSEVPDQADLLTQADAELRTDVNHAAQATTTQTLHQGHPLVLRTTDDHPDGPHAEANHRFWIHPAGA